LDIHRIFDISPTRRSEAPAGTAANTALRAWH